MGNQDTRNIDYNFMVKNKQYLAQAKIFPIQAANFKQSISSSG